MLTSNQLYELLSDGSIDPYGEIEFVLEKKMTEDSEAWKSIVKYFQKRGINLEYSECICGDGKILSLTVLDELFPTGDKSEFNRKLSCLITEIRRHAHVKKITVFCYLTVYNPNFWFYLKIDQAECSQAKSPFINSCHDCLGQDYLFFPCSIKSTEDKVVINPQNALKKFRKKHRTLLNRKECKKEDPQACRECLQQYFNERKPCITILAEEEVRE